MPESPGYRDEDGNHKWGRNGNTAKLLAVKWCSDNGFYNTRDIWDKGGWRFSANCDGGVPGDWSKRFSDEHARELGFGNRNDAARQNCKDKGYLGIDLNQWNFGKFFDASLKCVNPGWIGDWIDDGCQADGQKRFSRKVDTRGMDWDQAADWLINNSEVKQHNFSRVWKENKGAGGMWIIALRNDNNCFIYNETERTNQCINPGQIRMTKKCNNWPNGWTASNDVVNSCKKNAPIDSTPQIFGTEVWAEWTSSNTSCNLNWIGDWIDDGCQADGQKRFSRKVDAKGMDWDKSADWLIANDTRQYNFSKVWKENKGVGGMWVIALRNDNNCFIYNEAERTNECDYVNNRQRMSKKCNNWPNGWTASNNVVNGCKKNAPVGSEVKVFGTQVWAEWYQNNNCSYKDGNFVYNENIKSECLF